MVNFPRGLITYVSGPCLISRLHRYKEQKWRFK